MDGMRSITLESGPSAGLEALRRDPRRAVREDGIICLICGRVFRQLTNTHLRSHVTTPREYKARFGYNRRRALMCEALLRLYTDRAIRTALAALIRRRPIVSEPELRRRGGLRPIALEELLNRRELWFTRSPSRQTRTGAGRQQ